MRKLIDEVESEFLKWKDLDSSDYDFPLAAVTLSRFLRIVLKTMDLLTLVHDEKM